MEPLCGPTLSRPENVNGTATDSSKRLGMTKSTDALTRLLLVINSPMRRQCLEYMLRSQFPDCLIHSVASVGESPAEQPAVVLLEIGSAAKRTDRMREQVAELRLKFRDCPILALSDEDDTDLANEAIRIGLRGFLLPSANMETVVAAIALVAAGEIYVPSALIDLWRAGPSAPARQKPAEAAGNERRAAMLNADKRGFTGRELEVIEQLHQGKPNKIIAYDLKMSESTVKVHMRNIMRKLSATNRTQVASLTREAVDHLGVSPMSVHWTRTPGVTGSLDLTTGNGNLGSLDVLRLSARNKPMQ